MIRSTLQVAGGRFVRVTLIMYSLRIGRMELLYYFPLDCFQSESGQYLLSSRQLLQSTFHRNFIDNIHFWISKTIQPSVQSTPLRVSVDFDQPSDFSWPWQGAFAISFLNSSLSVSFGYLSAVPCGILSYCCQISSRSCTSLQGGFVAFTLLSPTQFLPAPHDIHIFSPHDKPDIFANIYQLWSSNSGFCLIPWWSCPPSFSRQDKS